MSAGIICVTSNNQMLMVKRATTFAYATFLRNQYVWESNSRDRATLNNLFSNMTGEEKKIIYSLNFDVMWFKYWSLKPMEMATPINHRNNYKACENVFNKRFLEDGGQLLRSIIAATSSVSSLTLYEFPRGKIENEEPLTAAKREFEEETHIKAYTLISSEPIEHRIRARDCDKEFTYKFFVADINLQIKQLKFGDFIQRIEIDEICFVPAETVKFFNSENAPLVDKALAMMKTWRSH